MQITFPGGPRSPAPYLSAPGGQECGLPARKRPRWPLSQAAGRRATPASGRWTGPERLTTQQASHVQGGVPRSGGGGPQLRL